MEKQKKGKDEHASVCFGWGCCLLLYYLLSCIPCLPSLQWSPVLLSFFVHEWGKIAGEGSRGGMAEAECEGRRAEAEWKARRAGESLEYPGWFD